MIRERYRRFVLGMFLIRLGSLSGLLVTIADLSRILPDFRNLWWLNLTRKGVTFAWTGEQQVAFDTLKACLLPILDFPTEEGRFILDTDASLFAVGGVLNQLQDDREVVIAYGSQSLWLSQRRYCTTRREMLAAVAMCTHFRSYLRGAFRWLQKFRNSDGMLARWYYVARPVFGYI